VQDFEMSPLSQPAAAVQADPDYTDTEDTGDDDLPAAPPARPARTREGLPAAYRMRHASHYVEQLMGDAPIQTVRQISIDQIDRVSISGEGAGSAAGDVTDLAASIVQVGVLQPLLVVQGHAARFQLIAGENRLTAAVSAGLESVPCLVVHADEARAAELRAQAAVTSTVLEPDPEPEPAAPAPALESSPARPFDTVLTAAVADVGGTLDFVSALMPAASAARSTFQQAMIADVIKVEKGRAAAVTAAASFLSDAEPLQPEEFDWLVFTEQLRTDVALEARLRGVEVEWLHSLQLRTALADRKAVMTAWTSILHATLDLTSAGDRVTISLATPRVRPAIIFTVSVRANAGFTAVEGPDEVSAFAGTIGELLLASARQSAQRQGGRLSVTAAGDSLTIEFAAPQPLAYWH
jgi:hypothetical protein